MIVNMLVRTRHVGAFDAYCKVVTIFSTSEINGIEVVIGNYK